MKKISILNYLLIAILHLFCINCIAKADSFSCIKKTQQNPKQLLELIENRYQQITMFKSKFVQQSYFIGADEWQESKGNLSFKKPGKMNWQYFAPDEQTFVSNSDVVYWYQPKEKQVTIRNITSAFSSEIPLSFLLGVGELTKDFSVLENCETEDGTMLKLDPNKKSDSLNQFYLLVNKNDYFPKGARIIDSGGNETKVKFLEIDKEVNLSENIFNFEIPKGTDIIDQRQIQ